MSAELAAPAVLKAQHLPLQLCSQSLGGVLVVAPHPDDEAIGCGGLLALLRQCGQTVFVLLLSDGEMSHPGSSRWPAPRRAALRRAEFAASLQVLGVDSHAHAALAWPDGALPGPDDPSFERAASTLAQCLRRQRPDTLLVPWRRDPHPDHRAASASALAANARLARPARVLEYPVWAAERGTAHDQPRSTEAKVWRLDIAAVVATKLAAVAAHRSQCGGVIDDDPEGFTLPAAMRARCAQPWETYYEVRATGRQPQEGAA